MVSRKPYPDELRERAVQMVFELRAETGNARGSIARVGHCAVWFGLWLGVLQAAYATGSRSLMRVFIWSTPSFVLVLLGLVLGLAVASEY
jgi:hypothetical protein